ncbi:glutamate-ammonia-ligase adenylyltransferase [Sinobacterium caligoides]|uniref:Bifunctional glutamine synthetase adenylyltransferase/adenylyl-removing enzyme n=1 Tax=Sinobacterium caligoides TaxID=933926 RepID=A0A3N2DGB3_9GAMM|nr:bifunctional [glutamate--ammonia ligase]-adenylyl-L-tyrosine phosphorylase/[glutamate--ammonia-ligase] adenylyltransferase [Sinobacterium caligoides]ROR98832.1 glutamate-ammonia-ligase adenylyltransferase [Sinobacterium caligoides]
MSQLITEHLPAALLELTEQAWAQVLDSAQTSELALPAALQQRAESRPALARELATAMMGSEYFAEQCQRQPAMLVELLQSDALHEVMSAAQLRQELAESLLEADSFEALCSVLRRFRRRQMCRIIYRDFNRLATMEQTTAELSALADSSIDLSLAWLYQQLSVDWGTPVDSLGQPQQMVVVGMGKLGACELNLSSDVDLIFVYPSQGETRGGQRVVENHKFFLKLGQQLIKSLDQVTADGFVFRVDMRLRPWGQSGALVLSFDAFEAYYRDHGREWERYAMIKARIVAGDKLAGERLMQMLKPFVFRKYVDYSVIDALRSMKQMITREVSRRGLQNDVKLGGGGIREVEFIAQVFQLIRGGRDVELQDRRLLRILRLLKEYEYLPAAAVDELRAAYCFLRNSEHGIQGYQDKQTQALPVAPAEQLRLAAVMGFACWDDYYQVLSQHREAVATHFRYLIEAPEEENADGGLGQEWEDAWLDEDSDEQVVAWLHDNGFSEVEEAWRQLSMMRSSKRVKMMQRQGRERLDLFMPRLLASIAEHDGASTLLLRMLPFVEAVLRRSAYMVLLLENPQAMQQLTLLCSASPWIAKQLATHPVLLDELLNVESLYTVPDRATLSSELQMQLLRLPEDDLEGQMDVLRYFRSAHVLRVAASEVTGRLPLMQVSDYLSYIAEVILQQVLDLAWRDMTASHGRPQQSDGHSCDPGFTVVGFGKLGGLELGYSSDLDLVFLYDADAMSESDGDRPISAQKFYNRLGQKIIHIMTTRTTQGALYEVDMRLRPSGNAGLLATSLKAFERYQLNDAWTWEHQALVRARVVAGDRGLGQRFDTLRREILRQPRDWQKLRVEVVEMRQKMRDHLLPKTTNAQGEELFHLKHGSGGIVDIEFMVQFAVLALANQHPALTEWSDNVRILETLSGIHLVPCEQTEAVAEAYKAYRAHSHRLALQHCENSVVAGQYVTQRQLVTQMWQQYLHEQAVKK